MQGELLAAKYGSVHVSGAPLISKALAAGGQRAQVLRPFVDNNLPVRRPVSSLNLKQLEVF